MIELNVCELLLKLNICEPLLTLELKFDNNEEVLAKKLAGKGVLLHVRLFI